MHTDFLRLSHLIKAHFAGLWQLGDWDERGPESAARPLFWHGQFSLLRLLFLSAVRCDSVSGDAE